jgi:hypothetical protein
VSFQREINRLAGTTGKEAQHAANVLAGTTGKELLYALNIVAGTTGRGLNHVVRLIALANGGDGTKEANIAFDDVEYGAIVVGGFDTIIRAFSQGFVGGAAYFDGGGLEY